MQKWEQLPILDMAFWMQFQKEDLKMWYGMVDGKWEIHCGRTKWQEYGIVNPYRDLTDKEHVYLVDNKIDLTVKYIQKLPEKCGGRTGKRSWLSAGISDKK